MKFIVDAQLPRQLADLLNRHGFDALHTLDLSSGNRTKDEEINSLSIEQQRVLITKDADFVSSFLLKGLPYKLLLVGTGNIRNPELLRLIDDSLDQIVTLFADHSFLEINNNGIHLHS